MTSLSVFTIPIIPNKGMWFWLTFMFGAIGIFYAYTSANAILRAFCIYIFISCFFSRAPYISFILYGSAVAVFYYYLLCRGLIDFGNVFKWVEAIFLLNLILLIMQCFGLDNLSNFAVDKQVIWGIIGNPMTLSSYMICLAPFLIVYRRMNIVPLVLSAIICGSSGALIALAAGLCFYLWHKCRQVRLVLIAVVLLLTALWTWQDGIGQSLMQGRRWPIWKETAKIASEKPLSGWGIGTYKIVFPAKSEHVAAGITNDWKYKGTQGNWLRWMRAHNCWLQFHFELGYFGDAFILTMLGWLAWLFARAQKTELVIRTASGAVIVALNMTFYFPTRMIQAVPALVCFLAFYVNTMKGSETNGRIGS